MATAQESERKEHSAFGQYESIPTSAAFSFLLICPFKGAALLNKGRWTALKDSCSFVYLFHRD